MIDWSNLWYMPYLWSEGEQLWFITRLTWC